MHTELFYRLWMVSDGCIQSSHHHEWLYSDGYLNKHYKVLIDD